MPSQQQRTQRNRNLALKRWDASFLQVIEGEEEVIEKWFEKITHDPRYSKILAFFKEPITARKILEWTMAFRNLNLEPENHPEGFNERLNRLWADLSDISLKARAFMKMFVTDPSKDPFS